MLIDNHLLAIFSPQAQDFLHLTCRAFVANLFISWYGHEDRWWRHKVVQHVFRSSMHPIDRRPQQLVGCRQLRKSAISITTPPIHSRFQPHLFYCWTRRLVIRTASLLFAPHRWKEATDKKCDTDFTMNMIIHFPTVDCHLLDGKQPIYLSKALQNGGGVRCFTCNLQHNSILLGLTSLMSTRPSFLRQEKDAVSTVKKSTKTNAYEELTDASLVEEQQ